MIACLPRAIAPIASQVVICDASSKMTTSKAACPAGRYCATESGDISTQGANLVKASGISEISVRIGMLGRCSPS